MEDIVFNIKIQCITVKDENKVDENVLSECLESHFFYFNKQLMDYYQKFRENLDQILALYIHDPYEPGEYEITKLLVPQGTQVIAIETNAIDRTSDARFLFLTFKNAKGQTVDEAILYSESERSIFQVFVPPNTHFINYNLGRGPKHFYTFGSYCRYCEHESDSEDSFDSSIAAWNSYSDDSNES